MAGQTKAQKVEAARAALAVEHPAELQFLRDQHELAEQGGRRVEFYESLYRATIRWGALSEAQLAALQKSIDRKAEWEAQDAAEKANGTPVVEGRGKITGEVMSVKGKNTPYGYQLKMVVRDDRGFKVWGTVPTALIEAACGEDTEARYLEGPAATAARLLPGRHVEFTATVTVSDNDEQFGFYKRPADAVVAEAIAA